MLATFVDKFARALHEHGKVLSLDVETADYAWWNASALNASALDSMADMSTYRNFADFMISLGIALEIAGGILGIVIRHAFVGFMSTVSFWIFISFTIIALLADACSFRPGWHYCCLGFSVASIVGYSVSGVTILL